MTILAVGVVWFWHDSLRIRDAANAAAMEACARVGLQFLDGTVAFSRLRPVRDAGRLRLRRSYVFDYTANSIGRLQGFVVMIGDQVETLGFASTTGMHTDPTSRPSAAPGSNPHYPPTPSHPPNHAIASRPTLTVVESGSRDSEPPTPQDSAGKVLDLSEWRKSRQQRH